MQFLIENAATIAAAAVLLGVAAGVVIYLVRTRKKCGACAFCAQRGHCSRK